MSVGYVEQVCADLLLSFGANPDSMDAASNTPLMMACHGGHSSIVRLLIQCGASANKVNASRQTALHLAASGRRDGGLLCARVLLTETDCLPSTLDNEDRTPLLQAAISNQVCIDTAACV
jgi:ankyrin repeat protein